MFVRTLKISRRPEFAFDNLQRFQKRRKAVMGTAIGGVSGILLYIFFWGSKSSTWVNEEVNKTVDISQIDGSGIYSNVVETRIQSYCTIKNCQTIACSVIPSQLDPGEVVTDFIETDFKMDCGRINSIKLIFENCKFPSNRLRKNWLRTDLVIEDLSFDSCSLTELENGAFDSAIFEETKKLSIVNNAIYVLRKSMFEHLPQLSELTIRDNFLRYTDFDLLINQAHALQILQLDGVISNDEVLKNITGGSTLQQLQILSLRGNSIPNINGKTFAGASKVQSLYLDSSHIATISADAFQSMGSSISLLIMRDNDIKTLPEGIFDHAIRSNPKFRVSIDSNPFHCDCKLKWMQDFVREYPFTVEIMPKCRTPKINVGLTFSRANFCNELPSVSTESSTKHTISTVTLPVSTEVNNNRERINIVCSSLETMIIRMTSSRKLLWLTDYQLEARYPGFFVNETSNGAILVNLPTSLERRFALLWFESKRPEKSLVCTKNLRNSYLIRETRASTAYTICLLLDSENSVSPFNCLSLTTSAIGDSQTWLTDADKSTVFAATCVSILTVSGLAVLFTFFVIRKNPALLKGSKRIVLAKGRTVDAIVLPKGIRIPEKNESKIAGFPIELNNFVEDGYVTPLPPTPPLPRRNARRGGGVSRVDSRVSRISSQSDGNTYVSGLEPSIPQIVAWKFNRLMSEIENRKSRLPPLPPRQLPSLSSAVDSKETDDTEILAYTV